METINLKDIKSEGVLETINEYDSKVRTFVLQLNKLLPEGFKLKMNKSIFEINRKETNAYHDDGNTQTEGYNYGVYWVYPLLEEARNDVRSIKTKKATACLYFHLETTERIFDHKKQSGHYCSMHLCKLQNLDGISDWVRLVNENDNYRPGDKLTPMLLAHTVKEIRDLFEMCKILNQVELGLKDVIHSKKDLLENELASEDNVDWVYELQCKLSQPNAKITLNLSEENTSDFVTDERLITFAENSKEMTVLEFNLEDWAVFVEGFKGAIDLYLIKEVTF